MSALKKSLVHLALLCLVIATVNAKTLEKRDVEEEEIAPKPRNYFEDMLNSLKNLANIPIFGPLMKPYISLIYNTAKRIDNWSDGSLSSLVNSMFPCYSSGALIKCSGTLNRSSLHTLVMKMLNLLPFSNSMLPMLEFARGMIV